MTSRYKQIMKMLILGDSRVGKTSIRDQFINHEFLKDYHPTIGLDFLSKSVDIDGTLVTVQIWDIAGIEKYQPLSTKYFQDSDCCALVYDISDKKSFNNILRFKNAFLEECGLMNEDKFPFLLLGNKVDLSEGLVRNVSEEDAKEFAEANYMKFYEVSAKTSDNLQIAFESIIREALRRSILKNGGEKIETPEEEVRAEPPPSFWQRVVRKFSKSKK